MKLSYMKEQCSVLQIFNNFEKKKQMGATWGGGCWLVVGGVVLHSWDTHKWEPLEIEKGAGDIFY